MTVREHLIRAKKIYGRWSISSFALMIATLSAGQTSGRTWLYWISAVAFVGYLTGLAFYKFRVRCTRCNGNIGLSTNYFHDRRLLFLHPVKHCPFCGVSLDSPSGI